MNEIDIQRPIDRLQSEVAKLPQYEPVTRHYFHGGMYCREVWRAATVLVIGKVHKKEHFYVIVSGHVRISTDEGVRDVVGPQVLTCRPGTKRAVYAVTDALCMTFHRIDSTTVEEAERELVEDDPQATFAAGNKLKEPALQAEHLEALT